MSNKHHDNFESYTDAALASKLLMAAARCDQCDGAGWSKDGGSSMICFVCSGRGTRAPRCEAGVPPMCHLLEAIKAPGNGAVIRNEPDSDQIVCEVIFQGQVGECSTNCPDRLDRTFAIAYLRAIEE